MSRIFIDSFETQNLNLWSASNATIVSSSGKNMKGDYCCYTGLGGYFEKDFTSLSRACFSFLWRPTHSDRTPVYIYWNNSLMYISGTSSGGKLYYGIEGNQDLGAISISLDTTYFVQIDSYLSGSSVCLISKINGALDYAKCRGSSSTYITSIKFGRWGYFDNIVIDDTTIPEQTEIVILKPNGVGSYSDFVPTPSGNNYTCVDEVPYSDFDYVSSGIVNAVDTYTLEDLPSNAASVKCIQPQLRARKDVDSPLTKFNFVIRDNLTNYHSSDVTLSNDFSTYYTIYADGPTGSGFWHPPNVNAMEIGVRTRI